MFIHLQIEQIIHEFTSSAHLDFREFFSERKRRYGCMHTQTTEQLIFPEHIMSLACLSTCPGGINRRKMLLCCTLERKQRVIAGVLSSSKCLRVMDVNERPKKTNLLKTAKTVTYVP